MLYAHGVAFQSSSKHRWPSTVNKRSFLHSGYSAPTKAARLPQTTVEDGAAGWSLQDQDGQSLAKTRTRLAALPVKQAPSTAKALSIPMHDLLFHIRICIALR